MAIGTFYLWRVPGDLAEQLAPNPALGSDVVGDLEELLNTPDACELLAAETVAVGDGDGPDTRLVNLSCDTFVAGALDRLVVTFAWDSGETDEAEVRIIRTETVFEGDTNAEPCLPPNSYVAFASSPGS